MKNFDIKKNELYLKELFFFVFQNKITVIQEHTSENKDCNYVFEFQGFGMCPLLTQGKKPLSGGAIFFIM
jgi:hypothetical protein